MKKITLAMIGVAGFFGSVFGQAIISPTVPTVNSSTQVRLPNGTSEHKSLHGVMLLRQSDLSALTASNITGAAFIMLDGTDPVPSLGTMTFYVENTSDVTNNKSALGWNGAIATMSVAGNGNFSISTVAQTSIVPVGGFTPFTYTGAGLYVAWAYEESTPVVNTNTYAATWAANNAGTNNGLCSTSSSSVSLSAPNTMSVTDFRPVVILTGANTATNEVSVDALYAPGKVAKLTGTGHVVSAIVTNRSNGPLSPVTVSLGVAGANLFADVQVIPTLAAGASTLVNFASFNPTANGINTLVAGVASDQNNNNNVQVWTESVTCNEIGKNPINATYDQAYGANTSGIWSTSHTLPVTASLTAIKYAVGNSSTNTGNTIYGVLLDNTGSIIATSNTITLTAANSGNFVTFNFANVQVLANTEYFYGVAQPASGYYPLGVVTATAFPAPLNYSYSPIGGGAPNPSNFGGYLGIEPVFNFSATAITVAATNTRVCKTSPLTVTLTAAGADSYAWSVPGLGNTGTAVYTPTVSGSATQVQVSVIGTFTSGAAAGCKSSSVSVTFSLSACTGIAENTGNSAVKVMPNPSVAGKTTITNLNGESTIRVYNTLGQVVINRVSTSETETIDLSTFPSGNYLIRITDKSNETRTVKLVNQN